MTAPLAFITGASSGIGQALATRFLQAGYRVALVARRVDDLDAWAQRHGGGPARCAVYAADVRDIASIHAAAQACIAQQGLPDVVVANAGISIGIDGADHEDLDVLRATLETNVLGLAATLQPFVRGMCERRHGTLVGVASVAGVRGLPGHGAYCASKAAVISYCESLRGECRPFGVRVVTLSPGYVDTPLTRQNRYPMPFLLDTQTFAQRALRVIEQGRAHPVIPWQMGWVAKLLRVLPCAVFDRAVARMPRKQRRPR